jgi:hypothetical protein
VRNDLFKSEDDTIELHRFGEYEHDACRILSLAELLKKDENRKTRINGVDSKADLPRMLTWSLYKWDEVV